jgi:hypothetical protein
MSDVMERKIFCHACGFYQSMYLSRRIKSENLCCPSPNCQADGSVWFVDTRK